MAEFYKILKADPLGDPWTPSFEGAKPTQNWWCQVEGVEKNVSIGKQVGNTLIPGQHVYGDLMYAKSQKGNEYWKFKSAKVPDGVQRPADSPAQAQAQAAVGQQPQADMSVNQPAWFNPWGNILMDLQKDMKLLKGEGDEETPEPAAPAEPAQDDEDEKITQEDIDKMFTPPVTPDDTPEPGSK